MCLAGVVLAGVLIASSSVGCGDSSSAGGTAPSGLGLSCESTTSASDADAARSALAAATPGTCVVLQPGSYAGPFTVPAGVGLVAQEGSRATITGGTAQEPAVTLGEGSQLALLDLTDAPGVGLAVRAASAVVASVSVSGAKTAALAVLCHEGTNEGCATRTISLSDVTLSTSTLGLWVSGAHVAWKGGSSSGHEGTGLASAAGVVAQDGARLELDGVTVEKNQGVGILVDGEATTASIKNATINENGERGIWAQHVNGSLAAPAVAIEASQITKNKIVGVGATASHGITITGGLIADTVAAPVVTNLQSTEQVGDGVGIFAGSADVKIDGAKFENNARTAGIVDGSDRVAVTGIIIVSGIGASDAGLKFVVQNASASSVQIDSANVSTTAKTLGISAPQLAVPSVL
jgi:hypothetical protein